MSCQKKNTDGLYIINDLSGSLDEISGITKFSNEPYLYAINDSGNSNTIYQLDLQGEIVRELTIDNAKNHDWEDLAYDFQNNIYIGDFGNNYNDRKNLAIYTVSDISNEKIKTLKTNFRLEDQTDFPPKKKNRNFDIEAFIYLKGNFYLFTKNRSSEFNGETKLYKVPAQPGNQIATLITSYKTCDDASDCFITGAAINATGDVIALLTYNKIFVLKKFKGDDLFSGTVEKIKLHHSSQKEGICFKNESTLIIVDEKGKNKEGFLYEYILN
ncbi:hypothetical protein GCM10022393_28080 [Aquimarina addita]|uniref:Uncharacterized protein n=2 Tax=Aquimarina addita TaxID=870485 RepID=A0ABP6UM65_9FLAO